MMIVFNIENNFDSTVITFYFIAITDDDEGTDVCMMMHSML